MSSKSEKTFFIGKRGKGVELHDFKMTHYNFEKCANCRFPVDNLHNMAVSVCRDSCVFHRTN